jgi:hypothetical protein
MRKWVLAKDFFDQQTFLVYLSPYSRLRLLG